MRLHNPAQPAASKARFREMLITAAGLVMAALPAPAQVPMELTPELRQVVGSAQSPRGRVKKIRVIRESGGRVSWSPQGDFILIDRKSEDGYYDVYRIRPDGSDEQCLTCEQAAVLGKGHIGQPDWHPSGRYMVFQAQKRKNQGRWGRDLAATPGFGRHSDLWLMELATRRCFRLVHTPESDESGILHPHFSHDGTKLTWSEMYGKPKAFKGYGKWTIQVADFAFEGGRPVLSNAKSYEPGKPGWYENHGLSPDGDKLLLASTFDNEKAFHSKLYHYDVAEDRLDVLADEKWNEVGSYSPSGKRIVWMTGAHNKGGGTDYWCMNPDGSDKVRLTDWNNANLPSWEKKMIVAADSSLSPDGKYLVAYLQVNLLTQHGITVMIELEDDWERPGSG